MLTVRLIIKGGKMAQLSCPYCNEIGISLFRKSWLGPALSVKCKRCGKKIGVPYTKAMIACAPLFIAITLSPILKFNLYFGLLIALIISEIIYLGWVPIVKKEK
jgi:hypothetical protein